MEDLHKLYPEALPNIPISVIKGTPVDKVCRKASRQMPCFKFLVDSQMRLFYELLIVLCFIESGTFLQGVDIYQRFMDGQIQI